MSPKPLVFAALAACAAPPAAAQDAAEHACVRDIHRFVAFREPDTIKVMGVSGGTMEVIDYADQRIAARKFTVMVNSKGEQGGYTRPRPYVCWTSEDRQRVLDYRPKHD